MCPHNGLPSALVFNLRALAILTEARFEWEFVICRSLQLEDPQSLHWEKNGD